jgi:hypothetical protein
MRRHALFSDPMHLVNGRITKWHCIGRRLISVSMQVFYAALQGPQRIKRIAHFYLSFHPRAHAARNMRAREPYGRAFAAMRHGRYQM